MKLTGHVLVVDDESHVRLYISLILRTLGPVIVHQAMCGTAALALHRSMSPKPSLVMLDINMPGIDGLETLRLLRHEGATCPIVMLTSLASRQAVEDAITAGGTGFIRKDTPRAEIAALLAEIMDGAREQTEAMEPAERGMSDRSMVRSRDPLATRREDAWDRNWF